MHSNKYHGKLNLKYKENGSLQSGKKTPIVPAQTPKHNLGRIDKPRFDLKTPFGSSQKSIRKPHNCLILEETPSCRIPRPKLNRKSSSLTELPCNKVYFTNKWQSKEHGDDVKITNTPKQNVEISIQSGSKESAIARKVCKMFVLHAWRKSRAKVFALQTQVTQTKNKLQDLNIQVIVLKELLDREIAKVSEAMDESAQTKKLLENEIKVTKGLKEDLERWEFEKTIWDNTHAKMECETKVLEGELNATNDKLYRLKEECVYYKTELLHSREREEQLIAKIGVTETCLRDKTSMLLEVRKKSTDLEKQIADLVSKNEKLSEENETKERKISEALKNIKKMKGELNSLQNNRKIQDENIFNLNKSFAAATKELERKEMSINLLQNTVNEYKSEKEEFERNLKKARNRVVFEAIKISACLFMPKPLL